MKYWEKIRYTILLLYINRGDKAKNKEIFDFLYNQKDDIERKFGKTLEWERMDEKITCRIKDQLNSVSIFNKEDWDEMNLFLQDSLERLEKAFKEPVKQISNILKGK